MNSPTPLGVAERVGKNCGSRASGFEEDFTGHGIAVCLSHGRRRGDSSPEERLFQREKREKLSFNVCAATLSYFQQLSHVFRNKRRWKTSQRNWNRIVKKGERRSEREDYYKVD